MQRSVRYIVKALHKVDNQAQTIYYWRRKRDALRQLEEFKIEKRDFELLELYREAGLDYKLLTTIKL